MDKIIKKNGCYMDSEDLAKKYHVYLDANKNAYTCTLNQTNIKANNNKFYIVQLLENDNTKFDFILYTRYGRIGDKGVTNTKAIISQESGMREFEKVFKQKTGNYWSKRDKFEKKEGKYFMSDIDYEDDGKQSEDGKEKEEEKKKEKKEKGKKGKKKMDVAHGETCKELVCSLDEKIQSLLLLISDINMMKGTMKEFNIDLKKMPLGKISKAQIKQGYEILRKIADTLSDPLITPKLSDILADLTSEFYTLIPSSFGRRKPPIIATDEQVKKYSEMLEVLTDLEIAGIILKNDKKDGKDDNIHPLDKIYKQINIDLGIVPLDIDEAEMIQKYVKNSVGQTHNYYKLELLDIFKVNREEENARFKDYGNKMLLFHGSRVANFMGIFSKGLRINNNAPKTGSMFGPGSYFANSVSKSANYCCVDRGSGIGIILLCEVSLGKMYEREYSEYITWLPNETYQSTWGLGESSPDPNDVTYLDKDILVPYGKLVKNKKYHSLLYDEFIVYREEQIRIKYTLKLRFNFN